ncbi:hypothetical protein C900_02060 [Fulvivirga imtechensis AK7]|uniref:DUF4199 domain-containing protein n=1 Tax=Fulvivirga imtechensis AK7 TaxID=1237149 RepID=L8JX51_9BACT|nr:DUF4199 domain-containing protein [Fulvivirga imtechensis]ELR73656.1 hypothetical protein C900_02060 [Fulvivirga imtechensis AK7]
MQKQSIEGIGIKYGILSAIAYILFFFLMQLVGLAHFYWLRALNYIFLFAGIFLAIREYKAKHVSTFAYMNGIGVGIMTSVISTAIFAVFIAFYLGIIDPEFMQQIQRDEMFGQYLNPYIAGALIFLEGSMSGAFTAYVLMQYFKRSHADDTV